jgi:exonuclease SbcC
MLEINDKIKILSDEIKPIEMLKNNVNQKKNCLDELNPKYQEYLINIDSASRLPEIINQIDSNKKSSEEIKYVIIELNENITKFEKLYNQEIYYEKSAELDKILAEQNELVSELNLLNVQLISSNSKIEKNKMLNSQIDKLNKDNNLLSEKSKLVLLLRNNLKSMGQLIAGKLLEKIQIRATENFRLISGRNEGIVWKSDISSAYQVYLLLPNGKQRNFDVLSGGEQMMVAISLRAAMNSILTNSKFVIFDEPTANLDNEKRKALSESLNYILHSLDQAIIVTHDDTFMEMAQNIYEFN